jgi:hypothetical protein
MSTLQKLQESLTRATQARTRPKSRIMLVIEECNGAFFCHVLDRSQIEGEQVMAGSVGLRDLEKALVEVIQELDTNTEVFLSRTEKP